MEHRISRQIKNSAQKLSLGMLWKELQVLSKLLFRGKDQHRRDKSYQRLLRVSRDLKRYQNVAVANTLKKLSKTVQSSSTTTALDEKQATDVATKVVECAKFTAQLLDFIEVTFSEVHQRLTLNLFIPFNLLMLSSLSRMWYCLRYHLSSLSEAYLSITSDLISTANQKLRPNLWSHFDREYYRYFKTEAAKPVVNTLGTVIPRPTNSVAVPLPVVTLKPTDLDDSLTSTTISRSIEEGGLTSTSSWSKKSSLELNPAATNSSKEIQPHPDLHLAVAAQKQTRKRKRSANTLVVPVRCGRRLVRLNVRSRRFLKRLRQNVSSKLNTTTLHVQHVKLSSLKKEPVGIPRYKGSRYHFKLVVASSKERLGRRSSTDKRKSVKKKISTVQKLQHQFVEDIETAAVAIEPQLKKPHTRPKQKLKPVTGNHDDIDEIFSALD